MPLLSAPSTLTPEKSAAWSENTGWLNAGGDEHGLVVTRHFLSGYAWSPTVGWINFGKGPVDGQSYQWSQGEIGVNRDATTGHLSGYAWGENIGYIRFGKGDSDYRSYMYEDGAFSGYAWGENVGWIALASLQRDPDNEWDGLRDALDPDDDNDLLPDTVEIARGYNPFDPADGLADIDHDGQANGSEYVAGTRDDDPRSVLRIEAIWPEEDGYRIQWQAVPGKRYTYGTSDRPDGPFTTSNRVFEATETTEQIFILSTFQSRFFQIQVVEDVD